MGGTAGDYLSHGNDHFLNGYNNESVLNTSTDDFDLMKYALGESQDGSNFPDMFSGDSAMQTPLNMHPSAPQHIKVCGIIVYVYNF